MVHNDGIAVGNGRIKSTLKEEFRGDRGGRGDRDRGRGRDRGRFKENGNSNPT